MNHDAAAEAIGHYLAEVSQRVGCWSNAEIAAILREHYPCDGARAAAEAYWPDDAEQPDSWRAARGEMVAGLEAIISRHC